METVFKDRQFHPEALDSGGYGRTEPGEPCKGQGWPLLEKQSPHEQHPALVS